MLVRAAIAVWATVQLLPLAGEARGDDAQIQTAIARGVRFLKDEQNKDGSWPYAGHPVGMTALAGLALAENGVTLDDPALKRAYTFVLDNASSTTQTYDVSLAILFLAKLGREQDQELIRQLGQTLVDGQLTSGGWTYTNLPPDYARPPASLTNAGRNRPAPARRGINAAGGLRAGFGDNSNTQFAVLGVWAAGRAGLDVSATMQEIDKRFRGTQAASGGWGYNVRGDTDAMTCAGLMALVLAKGHKTLEGRMVNRRPDATEDADGTPDEKKTMDSDPQIDAGIKRVEQYVAAIDQRSTLYFLWSVERVGVALGAPRIGRVDWYDRGSAVLLKTQRRNGAWLAGHGEMADTAFALLFLRRSNLTQGMPQLLSSRVQQSQENQMRSGGLQDLIRTIREPAPPKQ